MPNDRALPSFRLTLRRKIGLVIVLGLLIPALVGGMVSLKSRRAELMNRLHEDQVHLLNILAIGMQEPLWGLSSSAGRSLLVAVERDPRVLRIVIKSHAPHLSDYIFLETWHPERRHGQFFTMQQDIKVGPLVIGSASLEMDSGMVETSIARDQIFINS